MCVSLRSPAALRVLGLACALPWSAQPPTQPRPGQMPPLPLTQLDERTYAADLDNRLLTIGFAQPAPIAEVLLQLARGTTLSVIADPSLPGAFMGELKNVTVRQALNLLLPPLGLDYALDGRFITVARRQPQTRLFDINYIATNRTGDAAVGTAGVGREAPFARVSSATSTDVFAELTRGVQTLLSERATFNVDRKAGLLQVTDFPERLDRIGLYLDAVQDRVHRQVQIDARVVELELNPDRASGLDWTPLGRSRDAAAVLTALAAQGTVTPLAQQRLVSLNNEPALVKTDAFTLSVTPQIASDASVMLNVSPILSAPSTNASDMLARVADGETIVVAGLAREREVKETRNVGIRGGWFGRSTVVVKKRIELLILLTPRIVVSATD